MIEIMVMFLAFIILVLGLTGMWIFATTVKMDYKAHDGSYLVKK
tara:strand:- start:618 stop:749 length:132 start_codon:yes stop_codon:yes gene_type:complete